MGFNSKHFRGVLSAMIINSAALFENRSYDEVAKLVTKLIIVWKNLLKRKIGLWDGIAALSLHLKIQL